MNLYVKKIFVVLVSVVFSMQAMALEKTDVGGVQQPPVQWVHYLSAVEKPELTLCQKRLMIRNFTLRQKTLNH